MKNEEASVEDKSKRVNIGMEICAYPSVIFLDEPTSGLDAATAEKVIGVLRAVSKKLITIVAVIHQPRWSTYRQFDKTLLLSKGGVYEYFGPATRATEHFMSKGYKLPAAELNVNLADWYIDILAGQVIPSNMIGTT
eukprot:UN04276